MKIYFHPPYQFLNLNGRMGYMVSKGQFFKAKYNYVAIKMLEKANPNHVPDSDGKEKWPKTCYDDLKHDLCMRDKLGTLYAKNGCRVPWSEDLSNVRVCDKNPEKVQAAMNIYW